MEELQKSYENLSDPVPHKDEEPSYIHPRFCPHITHYTCNNQKETFRYEQPLEHDSSCVTFKATLLRTGSPIVVKFVRGYGVDAHKLMASINLAPKLIAHESLGEVYDNLNLVVMDYIDGKTLHDIFGPQPHPLPMGVKTGVRRALNILKSHEYVFGDLRRANVMLVNEQPQSQPIDKRIRFIDFDWAGKEGQGLRYPFHLASVVRTPSGASEYELITEEHQEKMFKVL